MRDIQRALQRRDAPGEADRRRALRRAARRVLRESEARFGPVSAENIQERLEWNEARLMELCREAEVVVEPC